MLIFYYDHREYDEDSSAFPEFKDFLEKEKNEIKFHNWDKAAEAEDDAEIGWGEGWAADADIVFFHDSPPIKPDITEKIRDNVFPRKRIMSKDVVYVRISSVEQNYFCESYNVNNAKFKKYFLTATNFGNWQARQDSTSFNEFIHALCDTELVKIICEKDKRNELEEELKSSGNSERQEKYKLLREVFEDHKVCATVKLSMLCGNFLIKEKRIVISKQAKALLNGSLEFSLRKTWQVGELSCDEQKFLNTNECFKAFWDKIKLEESSWRKPKVDEVDNVYRELRTFLAGRAKNGY